MTKQSIFTIILLACIFSTPLTLLAADFCFDQAAATYNISPDLLKAISNYESSYNPSAVNWNSNGTYDFGHMQINSSWYPVIGDEAWNKLDDPCHNTFVGTWILAQCIERHGYTWSAIGCYNAGSRPKKELKRVKYAWSIFKTLNKQNAKVVVAKQGRARPFESNK